ncbi:MAG: hypothetical protein JO341_10030 [Gammaproteobacteria bacterium]|nr:hypothetical protein [Gammaproteobacteria bacterium]MBV9621349.1 hypothetical protein [Gammaproteobacteria bacterium]
MSTVRQQLRNHAVALVSLAIALSSLGYNTWRNERTERNRNVRTATFELLMRLADLERTVFLAQYEHDARGGSPRTGWTYVLSIRDLAALAPPPVPAQAAQLQRVWRDNWEELGREDEQAANRIDDAIGSLRGSCLATLRSLR